MMSCILLMGGGDARANKFELLWYIFTGRDAGREDVPPLAASVPEC